MTGEDFEVIFGLIISIGAVYVCVEWWKSFIKDWKRRKRNE